MRIITGKARGKNLLTLEGNATRPTAARAKEAVFSVLQFSLADRNVLDLYSGSGQLALEALSRGARSATAVDSSADAVRVIKKNAVDTRLADGLTVVLSDVCEWLSDRRGRKQPEGGYDIVFIDPPYALGLIPDTLRRLYDSGMLSDSAVIVCEAASPDDVFGNDELLASLFDISKQSKYGIAYFTYLSPKKQIEG
ncbi:MAG: 16S rRNA (guanine(966)-N(2))-methyltransferase RsmD [Clostridia bacterium]|nr:16S rRNA (guanine(966)-N(2))-methyltransferase RsmD [Clostridia bacterium]